MQYFRRLLVYLLSRVSMHRVRTRRGKRARANFASRFHETGVDAGNSPRVRVGPSLPGIHLCRQALPIPVFSTSRYMFEMALISTLIWQYGEPVHGQGRRYRIWMSPASQIQLNFLFVPSTIVFSPLLKNAIKQRGQQKKKVKPGHSDYVIPRAGDASAGKIPYMAD